MSILTSTTCSISAGWRLSYTWVLELKCGKAGIPSTPLNSKQRLKPNLFGSASSKLGSPNSETDPQPNAEPRQNLNLKYIPPPPHLHPPGPKPSQTTTLLPIKQTLKGSHKEFLKGSHKGSLKGTHKPLKEPTTAPPNLLSPKPCKLIDPWTGLGAKPIKTRA